MDNKNKKHFHYHHRKDKKNEQPKEQKKPQSTDGQQIEKTTQPIAAPIAAPVELTEIVGVSFREAGKVYYFAPKGKKFASGDRVIVETSRGTEMGYIKVSNKSVPASEVVSPLKDVIRLATDEDIRRDEKNREMELEASLICKKKIANHGLNMSLVSAEYTFDNSKLIFYFTCESRVDFRELVKDLAATFRTRIELRQIGIRDETKMMGGIGICGRKYCCAGFLSDFVQVSIKMAKEQNFSLNSSKVSGACGRLMCCLRYEHETYDEAIKVTPPVGSTVLSPDGEGIVIEMKPLAAEVKVRLLENEKDAPRVYKVKDLKVLKTPKQKKGAKSEDDIEDEAED